MKRDISEVIGKVLERFSPIEAPELHAGLRSLADRSMYKAPEFHFELWREGSALIEQAEAKHGQAAWWNEIADIWMGHSAKPAMPDVPLGGGIRIEHVKGRLRKPVAVVTVTKDFALIRIDDDGNPEFWCEVALSRDTLQAIIATSERLNGL